MNPRRSLMMRRRRRRTLEEEEEEEEEDSWNRTAKVFSFLTTGAGKSMMC